jgi:hypothetical protein
MLTRAVQDVPVAAVTTDAEEPLAVLARVAEASLAP